MADIPMRDFFPMAGPLAQALARIVPKMDAARSTDVAADVLGAPVDGVGWLLHRMGVPVPGGPPSVAQAAPFSDQPVSWMPSAQVPLSSEFIRNLLRNPQSALDAAARLPSRGLF